MTGEIKIERKRKRNELRKCKFIVCKLYVIIAVNTKKIIAFELWFLLCWCPPLVSVARDAMPLDNKCVSVLCFRMNWRCKNIKTQLDRSVVLLPWLTQIEENYVSILHEIAHFFAHQPSQLSWIHLQNVFMLNWTICAYKFCTDFVRILFVSFFLFRLRTSYSNIKYRFLVLHRLRFLIYCQWHL